jgi:hypothetical protein
VAACLPLRLKLIFKKYIFKREHEEGEDLKIDG